MVSPAEQHEVVEPCRSAVGPVPDVVRVGETVGAAWEAASGVAVIQGPSNGGRHGARAAADVEDAARGIVCHDDATGIAGEAARRSRGNADAAGEHRLAGVGVLAEGLGVNVDHHLYPGGTPGEPCVRTPGDCGFGGTWRRGGIRLVYRWRGSRTLHHHLVVPQRQLGEHAERVGPAL